MDDVMMLDQLFHAPSIADEERDGGVPVLCELQRQGDVYVIPAARVASPPRCGPAGRLDRPVVVVAGTNDHVLSSTQGATWAPAEVGTPDLGVLTVPLRAMALLTHTGHHAPLGVGPGVYVLRRQVEQVERCTPGRERAGADLPEWEWRRD